MIHIVIKERDGDYPETHFYDNADKAIEEVRYAKMMEPYIKFDRIRLFEATELSIEDIKPMTKEEIK